MHVMVVLQIIQTVFLQKFLMPFKEAIGSAGISDVKKVSPWTHFRKHAEHL